MEYLVLQYLNMLIMFIMVLCIYYHSFQDILNNPTIGGSFNGTNTEVGPWYVSNSLVKDYRGSTYEYYHYWSIYDQSSIGMFPLEPMHVEVGEHFDSPTRSGIFDVTPRIDSFERIYICSLQYHSYLYQEGGGLSYGDFNSLKILIVGRDNIMNHTVTPPGIFVDGYLAVTWLPINGSSQTILNIIGILNVLKVCVLVIIGLQLIMVALIL